MLSHIVLTNCTAKKNSRLPVLKFDVQPNVASINEVSERWLSVVQKAKDTLPAERVYVGRTVKDALEAAQLLGADVFFVSAGLGLVKRDSSIPAYNLSITPNQRPTRSSNAVSLPTVLADKSSSPAQWWALINRNRSLLETLDLRMTTFVWIAIPSSYVALIQSDLLQIPSEILKNVRIFTSPAGVKSLDSRLRGLCLPYDERLNSVLSSTGTRNDFPQRALLHYLTHLNGKDLELEEGKKRVLKFLSKHKIRELPLRKKKTDAEIVSILKKYWGPSKGSSSRLLRILRDDLKISCEQRRFSNLWRYVHNQKSGVKYAA